MSKVARSHLLHTLERLHSCPASARVDGAESRQRWDKHGENHSGWSSASLEPAGNQTLIFSHLWGARGEGLCNQISSVCRLWVQILWKELLGKQDPLLVYQPLASESISWLLQSPRKGFPHPALAATSPPLSLMHIVPLACGAEAVARESKLSPHVGPSVVAAVTRRRELGPSARSCRESLGRSTDLESLFSLLLIISLLCPPTGVPPLNSGPDS